MQMTHAETSPTVAETAWVAPDATVCGNVTLGPGVRVLHGARIVAEAGGAIEIGRNCIVMENAVVRATARHDCRIGDHCLIGPHAHVVGCSIAEEVFVATGASVFHGAQVGRGSECRINSVVHIKTRLSEGATVPIGWVAVGEPAQFLSPDRHEEIWSLQRPLDFPGWVYGLDRQKPGLMIELTARLSRELSDHAADTPVPDTV